MKPLFFVLKAACVCRVPTEIVKQRMQAQIYPTMGLAVSGIIKTHGVSGFFTGYRITVFREIPFSCIQFPLFEHLKVRLANYRRRRLHAYESSACGLVAGGFAAAVTTPLDVIKTRIMLSRKVGALTPSILGVCKDIISKEGPKTLLAGIGPRILWISLGGGIFLGMYDFAQSCLVALEQ